MIDLEKELIKELGLKEHELPPKTPYCQWCGGECNVGGEFLSYHRFYYEDMGIVMYSGWFSPDCAWLASCAAECVNNDNS